MEFHDSHHHITSSFNHSKKQKVVFQKTSNCHWNSINKLSKDNSDLVDLDPQCCDEETYTVLIPLFRNSETPTLKLHKFYWILYSCLITNNRWAKVSNGFFPKWWIMAYWRFISKPGLFYFINQKLFKLFFIIVDNSVCICWDGGE